MSMVGNTAVALLSPAEQLLWRYGISRPDEIDLEAIAYDLGAEVIYRPLGGCEARLVAYGSKATISIASTSNSGRRRFSLAHELAHWVENRNGGLLMCAKEDIGPQDFEAKNNEARANAFASQLLLPNYLVQAWMEDRKVSLDVASQLGQEFNSSLTAAAIRLVKLAGIPACVACHSQTGLAWHQRSSRFPSAFWVVPQLHQDTDAFRLAFGKPSPGRSKARLEPASRWISGRDAYRLEVTTQSIQLPESMVLTVLTL